MNADSPYISFLINGNLYLSGNGILRSHGIDTKERQDIANTIFNNPHHDQVIGTITQNKIDYIITRPSEALTVKTSPFLKTFFENKDIKIYQITTQ